MIVKFTDMANDFKTYWVADWRYCHGDFDKKLWDLMADSPDEKCIIMGKTCIERITREEADAMDKQEEETMTVEALFEDFLQTMDDIMGGGDTVARFRDRYQELTGKRIYIIGDGLVEEVEA